jgi:peptide/nickel transport system substrate-binding protein
MASAGCIPERPADQPTILFASGADLQSANPLITVHPLAKQVQKHVLFVPLASYDSGYRPVPRLASWTWSEDRTLLTFDVRRDVRWHDGVLTTADDVVWTLTTAQDPAVAYPRARDLASVERIERVDSFRVRLHFRGRQPVFPDVLTDLPILPAHVLGDARPAQLRLHPFNTSPVGNGPFAFREYRPNQRWVFERVREFPAALGRPVLQRLVIVVVDEATTKLAALTSGELDFAGISPAHAEFVREDSRLRVVDYPVQFAVALAWNLRRPPLDDARLRRALTMAVDRQTLVDAYLFGFGTVADGPVSPAHPWHVASNPITYDPEEAARQLDALGWVRGPDGVRARNGERLAFDLLMVSGDNAMEQMIQAQLARVGVAIRIRQLELASFLSLVQSSERDFDVLVTGVPGDWSLGHVAAMYGGTAPGPLAYPGYHSDAFDSTLVATRSATTRTALEEAWRHAQRILLEDHPTTWLYHARGVQGINRRVGNVSLDLRGELATVALWVIGRGSN